MLPCSEGAASDSLALAPFDHELPTIISTDTSDYGFRCCVHATALGSDRMYSGFCIKNTRTDREEILNC